MRCFEAGHATPGLSRPPNAALHTPLAHAARHPAPERLNEALVDSGASPLELAIDREDRRRYRAALALLRAADRDAIVARIELGYTYEQLALMLAKPTAESARLAVRRALVRLGNEMRRG